MEKLMKILDIKTIRHLHLSFIDNHGNFKEMTIDYPCENRCPEDREG